MTTDISAFGVRVRLVASATFPAGIDLSQFADDSDPIDVQSQEIAATAMGVNGDLVVWSRANALPLTLTFIPNTDDDRNMQVLLEANRVGRGKANARDIITITATYPDGRSTTWNNGVLTNGMVSNAIASAGRLKSKPYVFAFEGIARS